MTARRCSHRLGRRLVCALQWWLVFLQRTPARTVPLVVQKRGRIIVYSDATGGGALAYVLLLPDGTKFYAAVSAPRAMKRRLKQRRKQASFVA